MKPGRSFEERKARSSGAGLSGVRILSPEEIDARLAEDRQAILARSGRGGKDLPETPAALPQPQISRSLRGSWAAAETPASFADLSAPVSIQGQTT